MVTSALAVNQVYRVVPGRARAGDANVEVLNRGA